MMRNDSREKRVSYRGRRKRKTLAQQTLKLDEDEMGRSLLRIKEGEKREKGVLDHTGWRVVL